MKKQFIKSLILILVIGSIFSCGQNASKNDSTTEQKVANVENKVLHDGDDVKKGRVDNMHKTRFIELFFAYEGSNKEGIVAECFNTMFTSKGIPESKNTAPQELVEALDLDKMAKEYGVANVSLNGPKLWLPDWTEIEEGKERSFDGIEARWVAQLHMGDNAAGVKSTKPYTPQTIIRKSSLGWNKGTRVLLLDDAEGNTWVMKGFQLGLHPQHTYDEFIAAGQSMYKELPAGWKLRIETLEKELIETPKDGAATIMADEFFNVWDKSGPGMMNYKP
jgi:hypothetical protein